MLYLVVISLIRKEKKRNINNDLAVLPSHDSGSQVIGRGAISSFHSYYLWEFESFLCFFFLLYHCFVILIKYSRAQREKRPFSPIISPSVALELKGYLSDLRFSFVCFMKTL